MCVVVGAAVRAAVCAAVRAVVGDVVGAIVLTTVCPVVGAIIVRGGGRVLMPSVPSVPSSSRMSAALPHNGPQVSSR